MDLITANAEMNVVNLSCGNFNLLHVDTAALVCKVEKDAKAWPSVRREGEHGESAVCTESPDPMPAHSKLKVESNGPEPYYLRGVMGDRLRERIERKFWILDLTLEAVDKSSTARDEEASEVKCAHEAEATSPSLQRHRSEPNLASGDWQNPDLSVLQHDSAHSRQPPQQARYAALSEQPHSSRVSARTLTRNHSEPSLTKLQSPTVSTRDKDFFKSLARQIKESRQKTSTF